MSFLSSGKPESPCRACPLGLLGQGFVRGDGPGGGLLIIGEAPGATEALRGLPFCGAAGWMLDRVLALAGVERGSVRCANVLCCRPPSNSLSSAPYEMRAIETCRPLLEEEIERSCPKVIVAAGNIAMRALLGVSGIMRHRGYVGRYRGIPVVPTLHPSFLLPRKDSHERDAGRFTGAVILDLKKAQQILERGVEEVEELYTLDPSPGEALSWVLGFESAATAGRALYLSSDIETVGKIAETDRIQDEDEEDAHLDGALDAQITRIGFSYAPGVAMSIPMMPQYRDVVRRLLTQTQVPHVFWNGYAFDIPVLTVHGFEVKGEIVDAMWAWHHLQSSLPRGLESVGSYYAPALGAWKHLSAAEPARYNAIDADVAGRCYKGIRETLERQGRWAVFAKHVVELYPLLYKAGRVNGVWIDDEARQALTEALIAAKDRKMREAQTLVPDTLRAQKRWKRDVKKLGLTPEPSTAMVKTCAVCGAVGITKSHAKKCKDSYVVMKPAEVTVYRWDVDWATVSKELLPMAIASSGFNPVSQKQMIAYAKAAGHPIGTDPKTQRPAFTRRVRERLTKKYGEKHPIYVVSQELQDITKTLGTYAEGFAPDHRGRVYTSYTFSPATGRLASRNVNLQNVGHHSPNPHATLIRKMIHPPPGMWFVEADSSAIEAVMTGFFMEDPEYVQLAKTGIHDYLTCLELRLEFDRAKIGEYKRDARYAEARERNKRTVHGTNYGMSPRMLMMQFPAQFPTLALASATQNRLFEACPKLGPWQHRMRQLAHRQKYLENPWGYRCYFYDVFSKDTRTGEVILGNDAKKVVAFLPQSSAAAFMRDSLLTVGASVYAADVPGNLSIHDSICLCVREEGVEEAVAWITQLMTRPIPEMGGLRIGCEVKTGLNWHDMRVVRREDMV